MARAIHEQKESLEEAALRMGSEQLNLFSFTPTNITHFTGYVKGVL